VCRPQEDREAEAYAIQSLHNQNLERLEKELELLEKAEQEILIRLEKEKLLHQIVNKRDLICV
jgi:redox-regulated HSP33 family molecular chaperone